MLFSIESGNQLLSWAECPQLRKEKRQRGVGDSSRSNIRNFMRPRTVCGSSGGTLPRIEIDAPRPFRPRGSLQASVSP